MEVAYHHYQSDDNTVYSGQLITHGETLRNTNLDAEAQNIS